MDSNVRSIKISLKFINVTMEKKLIGVIMTVLGITGLIMAALNFVSNDPEAKHSVLAFALYSILGFLFFFAGIGLIRSTGDLTNRR
jgi:uncharacterized membrane protein